MPLLEAISSAVLIALGLLIIFFLGESGASDKSAGVIFVLGLLCIGAGGWIIVSAVGIDIILQKLGGIALAAIGIFFVAGFPADIMKEAQTEGMSKAGIFIGLIILLVGIYLILF